MKTAKKLIFGTILLIMLIIVPLSVQASAETEGYYTYYIANDQAVITDVDDSISGDVVIPSELGGYPVVEISDGVFESFPNITSVFIPESVRTIGDYAFYNCENILDITISNGVSNIGESAFASCIGIESIEIPDSVISIGEWTFARCSSLKSITVNENNNYYSNDESGVLFNKNKTKLVQYPLGNEMTEYAIPNSVTNILSGAFNRCANLENIIIPDSVTSIGNMTFLLCENLKSIVIPDSVTSIGRESFECCFNLTSVKLSENLTSIDYMMFVSCISLKNINIPNGISYIGDGAFYQCKSLEKLVIPNGVASLLNGTFGDCCALKSITIPKSVTYIEHDVVGCCESLTDIYYSGTEEEWNAITICEGNEPLLNATVHFTKPCDHTDPNLETKLIEGKKPTCTQTGVADAYACAQCGVIVRGGE